MATHFDTSTTTGTPAPHAGPRFNALKHGLYRASILMPGEDAEAYRQERLALFHLYRPQTIREAKLVDQMAQWQWQHDRSVPMQARCDGQALDPVADAADRVAEPLAHRRLHSTMDVTLHRLRLDRAVRRNEKDLFGLQKLRRMGLIEGAVKLPRGYYMELSGEIVPVAAPIPETPACQVAPKAPAPGAAGEISASTDGGNQKCGEEKETVKAAGKVAGQAAGQTRTEQGPTVVSGRDARPTGPGPSKVELLNAFGKHAAPALPPYFTGMPPVSAGYTMVSSL